MDPAQLVPLVLIAGAFYFLIIRPQRNRQRAAQRLRDQLTVGSRVMTTSGLYAEVVGVEDDVVLLEASPGVTTRWTKAAVSRILPEPDADDDSEDTDAEPAGDEPVDDPNAPDSDSTDRPT